MQAWKKTKVFFWEEAPFFKFLLPLILSIVFYELNWLPCIGERYLLIAFSFFWVFILVFNFFKHRTSFIKFSQFILLHCAVFLLGWWVCAKNNFTHNPLWFGNFTKSADVFAGRILDKPLLREKTWKLKIAIEKAVSSKEASATKGIAFVYVYRDSLPFNFHQGDNILVPNKWTLIKNSGNPFEFDFARFCRWNGIGLQEFIARKDIALIQAAPNEPQVIQATHDWAMAALEQYIKDIATLGLMQAMLLGDEVNFDAGLRQSYSETGIIHIVAISGSHVMVFFWFISVLLFWIKNKRYEAVKYLIAVPLVCFYVAVAGAPTSAVRAAVMFSFLALGMIVQKNKQPLNQLLATGFFMLLYEPMWLFAVGFQLSFIAVLSLILFYLPICNWWTPRNKIFRSLWQAMAASIAAEILVAPLVIFYYHLLPTMFLFANLFAYMFMGAVLILGLVLVLVSKFGLLAKLLAAIITFIVVVFNGLVQWFQSLNPDFLRHLFLSLTEVTLLYITITCFAVFVMKKIGKALLLGELALLLLLGFITHDNWKAIHQQKLIVYNTGKRNYAELISGRKYYPLIEDSAFNADKDFATKEAHIALRSWQKGNDWVQPIISLNGKKFLFLNEPLSLDSLQTFPIDYLVLKYPLKKFNAVDLQKSFAFKKLIIAGKQKRYIMEQWKDSCNRLQIPLHLVMLDGAFVFE